MRSRLNRIPRCLDDILIVDKAREKSLYLDAVRGYREIGGDFSQREEHEASFPNQWMGKSQFGPGQGSISKHEKIDVQRAWAVSGARASPGVPLDAFRQA